MLGSKENITYAKCEIVKYLNPNGVVIIPANDFFLEKTIKRYWNGRIIKIELLDILQKNKSLSKKDNLIGYYDKKRKSLSIENKIFQLSFDGIHNASNFMFAYAVAKEFGIDFQCFNTLNFESLAGRNRILKSGKTTIMDESYNASPESVKACIKNLLEMPKNHFLIFGFM